MLTLIVGGSASGKSAFAENYAMEAGENRIYIATMQPMDNECLARIGKHRVMRAQKNFQTVECYTGLKQVRVPKDSVVLLECMSNLTANEIYAPEGVGEDRCSEEILAGVKALENQCRHLIIVSNEVFCLLYTSDAADDLLCVDLGGRRTLKKKKKKQAVSYKHQKPYHSN